VERRDVDRQVRRARRTIVDARLHSRPDTRDGRGLAPLISFLTTPEAQLDIFRDFGNLPTTPEIYARPEIQGLADPFFGGDQVGRLYVESVSGQQSRPYAVAERELDRIVLDTLREYAAGNHASAAEAWATAVARIEAVHASSG